jgi:uncharacterized protein (DUF2141 family)
MMGLTMGSMMRRISIWGGLAIAATLATATSAKADTVSVTVQGLKNQSGQVCLSLFANGQGFPSSGQNALLAQCAAATGSSVTIPLRNLASGNYAIALFHDANSNGKLDMNAFGIPTEGFGFSRNPSILGGIPQFRDAAFSVNGNTSIVIQLNNFF